MDEKNETKLYKYRSDENWERDIKGVIENYFWAAKYDTLNDPTESFFNSDKLKEELYKIDLDLLSKDPIYYRTTSHDIYNNIYKEMKSLIDKIGIFSLSKTYNDELLWSYYSNSHKGFCIEYDVNKLLDNYKTYRITKIDVTYSLNPPEINMSNLSIDYKMNFIYKILGSKSINWQNEKEERILTNFIGKHPHKIDVVSGIYFGVNSSKEMINKIIEKTKFKGIKYYKMKIKDNSYIYERELINTEFSEKKDYFIGNYSDDFVKVGYKINKINLDRINNKGEAEIILDDELSKRDLNNIAKDLKNLIFWNCERIIIWYFLKDKINDIAWGTSNWYKESDNFENNINI